jgi:hypothetical protein
MVPDIRQNFNSRFTKDQYQAYLTLIDSKFPGAIGFRLAETPIFLDKSFTDKILSACESIIDVIIDPDFESLTKNAVPDNLKVPNESKHSDFIAFDFGICENERGEIEPQLIEMQGFPSLFAFEVWQDEAIKQSFGMPANYTTYFSGLDKETYLQLLQDIITNGYPLENVILLEILPEEQKTKIDFYLTKEYIGIKTVCLTELIKEGKQLFYLKDGLKTPIKRIYNRIIFDELLKQLPEIQSKGSILQEELEVEWCPHPNWFYRISKYTLPFINHPYVPKTIFLYKAVIDSDNLSDYVLKPLFSFAGQGVIIDVTMDDIAAVKDPHNWILQRKVNYADIIKTPEEPAKAEIRIFYFWPKDASRPIPTNNLARISKGKMIGTRYNADKEWVGGTIAYFEQ